MATTWFAHISWTTPVQVDPEVVFDLMDDLATYSPSGSLSRGGLSGSISIALEAPNVSSALTAAMDATRNSLSKFVNDADIDGIEIKDEATMNRDMEHPVFPEVVGYAEIAEMAGVSRQRARAFRSIEGFPAPVIETAQGPLMPKAAVATWIEHRNTRSGRRATTFA